MNTNRRHAVAALIAAGLLWGTTVPLSKLALTWLSPGWLTVARFGLAAAVLLAAAARTPTGRARLRAAFTPKVLASGALGYGGSVMVQNAGIARTSVTHAALLIGAVPVLVAIIAAVWHRDVAKPVAWVGFMVSLLGVGLVTAGGGGGGATMAGDGLVLASLLLSAGVTVAQGRLLAGRDPVAVTAVQFLGATVGALLVSVCTSAAPTLPGHPGPVLALLALTAGGTLAPFTLFAFGQSRVSAEVAGAFLNLEPLVGAIAGAAAFGDPVGLAQVAGGAAIVAGIGLSSLPLLAGRRRARPAADRRSLALVGAELDSCESDSLPDRGIRVPHSRNSGMRGNGVFVVVHGGKFGARPGMGGPGGRGDGRRPGAAGARPGAGGTRPGAGGTRPGAGGTRPGGRMAGRPPARRPPARGRGGKRGRGGRRGPIPDTAPGWSGRPYPRPYPPGGAADGTGQTLAACRRASSR
jgi:O-acetylserine/cysteine efflux transporter